MSHPAPSRSPRPAPLARGRLGLLGLLTLSLLACKHEEQEKPSEPSPSAAPSSSTTSSGTAASSSPAAPEQSFKLQLSAKSPAETKLGELHFSPLGPESRVRGQLEGGQLQVQGIRTEGELRLRFSPIAQEPAPKASGKPKLGLASPFYGVAVLRQDASSRFVGELAAHFPPGKKTFSAQVLVEPQTP